ncbi:hypothetical protein ACQ4PT_017182 [Festuca glaucescens]
MELVVGASEATMRSLLAKLGYLLSEEYTLIRGVNADIQYINDELATMQSFLRAYGGSHGDLMKDWMKQIRDITYDIEDCIDDSGHRLHGLRAGTPCYFLLSSLHELLTWWPRRDISSRISILKMRAQQIGERRDRYGVNNLDPGPTGSGTPPVAGFDVADNQAASLLQLVATRNPVGVEKHLDKLDRRVTCIVGFGGVGKTAIATALYRNFGEEFGHRAVVTVSQSSDLEAILRVIKDQVKPHTRNHEQQDGSEKKDGLAAAAIKRVWDHVSRGTSDVMTKCCRPGTSEHRRDRDHLKEELVEHLKGNRYLILIDDVWPSVSPKGENMLLHCPKLLLQCLGANLRSHLCRLSLDLKAATMFLFRIKSGRFVGGLPLAIVTMAGHVACNPRKSHEEWLDLCKALFPESGKADGKELTQEEVGRIVSHCYNDMPAEIKTCSLYLSIFPKGYKISRKRLTRRWIAESFVCEKEGLSAEDVAETYFNHLIRRKIIQPVEHNSNGKVKKFIVHDMVLELIVTKASKENFITVVGGNWLMQPPSSKVRRLSLQGSDSKRAKDTEKMNLSHVRSLTMFGSLNKQLPSHSFKFGIVQVLDLEGCKDFKHHHIIEICRMLLLKYLSLRKTDTKQLPDNIGKLKNLETLDIRETKVVELPNTICQLERLVNILGGDKTTRDALKLPEEMKKKKMKALRILSGIEIVEGSADLRHLTELRKLAIYKLKTLGSDASFKGLRSSIEYLGGYSLHTLIIDDESSDFVGSLDDLSSPPKFLLALELSGKMVKLPNWIKQLSVLNKLTLSLTALRTDNLKDLSKLDALFSLTFSFRAKQQDRQTLAIVAENKLYSNGEITVPDGRFKSLKLLCLSGPLLPLLSFSRNAMPELERLELRYSMLEGLFGAENLAKLKEVHLTSDDKENEDRMTKEIASELGALRRIDGTAPRIIFHQRPILVKPNSG